MSKRDGFTLVELVVVVLILGILAAVAVPKVVRSAVTASESALKQDLSSIRNSVDLYAQDHDGKFPGDAADGLGGSAGSEQAFLNQLLYYSKADGTVSKTKDPKFPFGPYLRRPFAKAPVGAMKGEMNVKMENAGTELFGESSPSTAWRYDSQTGDFILNSNGLSSDGVTSYDLF